MEKQITIKELIEIVSDLLPLEQELTGGRVHKWNSEEINEAIKRLLIAEKWLNVYNSLESDRFVRLDSSDNYLENIIQITNSIDRFNGLFSYKWDNTIDIYKKFQLTNILTNLVEAKFMLEFELERYNNSKLN